jgi:acyl dehydratase
MDQDWKQAWQPVVDAIGQEFGRVTTGADEISAATIRRYLEPLEFDCALHYDAEVAREHGYGDIVAPNSSIQTFSLPPMWRPGQSIFNSEERNAQPETGSLGGLRAPLEPSTTGYFATDFEVEYFCPVIVGDRLYRRGAKLTGCLPRETKVGRGAFLTWESEICNQRDEVVARTRTTSLRYNPHVKGKV